jgi:hypothetical protein
MTTPAVMVRDAYTFIELRAAITRAAKVARMLKFRTPARLYVYETLVGGPLHKPNTCANGSRGTDTVVEGVRRHEDGMAAVVPRVVPNPWRTSPAPLRS